MQSFKRIQCLQKFLRAEKLDAFLITNPANIFYLTGVSNFDSRKGFALLVLQNNFKLIAARFYQAKIDRVLAASQICYLEHGASMPKIIADLLDDAKNIAFEREDLLFAEYDIFKKSLRGKRFLPYGNIVKEIRQLKDDAELTLIKKAAAITDKTMAEILKLIKPGVAELFLKNKTQEIMQNLGAQGCAFNSIIASGVNSADPHYEGSNKQIKRGQMVVIDIGARYKNYNADMTRTVFVGKSSALFRARYQMVLTVQEDALKNCFLQNSPSEVHNLAMQDFKKFGEDAYFIHSLGHGVGIEIHELPNLSPFGTGDFQNGMVFTIEPGIYHAGWGGIRIEDLCVMQNGKAQPLTKLPKTLLEICPSSETYDTPT